jgi:hypothetical protein
VPNRGLLSWSGNVEVRRLWRQSPNPCATTARWGNDNACGAPTLPVSAQVWPRSPCDSRFAVAYLLPGLWLDRGRKELPSWKSETLHFPRILSVPSNSYLFTAAVVNTLENKATLHLETAVLAKSGESRRFGVTGLSDQPIFEPRPQQGSRQTRTDHSLGTPTYGSSHSGTLYPPRHLLLLDLLVYSDSTTPHILRHLVLAA